jgi:hypothetical protein
MIKTFFFSNSLPQREAKEEDEQEVKKGLPFCAYKLNN